LFTGDHIIQGSTVVIIPPAGSMTAYLASLQALLREDIEWLAPGHGHLMNHPQWVIRKTIEHRLMREKKVLATLRDLSPADTDTLLKRVYDDVPAYKHPVARLSLTAHLIKLVNEGTATESDGLWRLR
ncbi:MAG: hypothetical protein WAO76_09770, partial [Georgfuchsia sp.]